MTAPDKRPYLSSARRRADLVGVAARLVVAGGWSALTMKGLALEAGVSRQLVYQHFADLPALLIAVTERLFEGVRAAMQAVLAQGEDGDAAEVASRTYQLYLELPREQRRMLRAITAEPDIESDELRRVRRSVRDRIIGLWSEDVRRRTGLPPARARALVWTMTGAAWSLGDLVDDGEIPLSHARELLGRLAAGVLQPSVARGARPRRAAVDCRRVDRTSRGRASSTKGRDR